MRSWDEGLDFPLLVGDDAEIADRIDLEAVLDLDAFTRHVGVVFDRLSSVAAGMEPAHA